MQKIFFSKFLFVPVVFGWGLHHNKWFHLKFFILIIFWPVCNTFRAIKPLYEGQKKFVLEVWLHGTSNLCLGLHNTTKPNSSWSDHPVLRKRLKTTKISSFPKKIKYFLVFGRFLNTGGSDQPDVGFVVLGSPRHKFEVPWSHTSKTKFFWPS